MKPIKDVNQFIEMYLNNELDPFEKEMVEQLIESNGDIKEEFFLRQKIDYLLSQTELIEIRERLKQIIINNKDSQIFEEPVPTYKSRYNLAAMVVILIGVGSLTVFYLSYKYNNLKESSISNVANVKSMEVPIENNSNTKGDQNNNQTDPNRIPVIEKDNQKAIVNKPEKGLYAHRYEESAYFESFIDNHRSFTIYNTSPSLGKEFENKENITFSWKNTYDIPLKLTLFDNLETAIFSLNTMNLYTYSEKLEPGLYYWKLELNNDVIYMGKFFIEKSKNY